jgi:hypothetical protein
MGFDLLGEYPYDIKYTIGVKRKKPILGGLGGSFSPNLDKPESIKSAPHRLSPNQWLGFCPKSKNLLG